MILFITIFINLTRNIHPMITDIVIPKDNEEEFTEIAERLGYKAIIFLYKTPKIPELPKCKLKIYTAFKAEEKEINKLQNIKKKFDFIISETTRKMVENKLVDFVYNQENNPLKDRTHHRSSGLNQVLCKIAKEKKKTICLNFNLLFDHKKRDKIQGRMAQNARLINKYNNKLLIASFAQSPYQMRNPKDLICFGRVIGIKQDRVREGVVVE